MRRHRLLPGVLALVIAVSAFGLSLRRDEEPRSARSAVSRPAPLNRPKRNSVPTQFGSRPTTERQSTDPVLDAEHRPGPAHVGKQTSESNTIVARFPNSLDPDRMADAVRDAGAVPVEINAALGAVVASVDKDDRSDVFKRLDDDTRVEGVEANRLRYVFTEPDDPGLYDQFHLLAGRFPLAWEVTKGSTSLDIAIIDTGVDLNHPDLAGRIVAGYDFVNNDSVANDDEGHGTMVAGIAAAQTNNGIGVAGAAWNARIMPVKVIGAEGSGDDFGIAQGIVWAVDHGAEIINLSLGGPGSSTLLDDAVAYATSHGVTVVAASGNEGTSEPMYPAAIPDVVAVGATDLFGNAVFFSNHGQWVDLTAPGTEIVSTAMGSGENYAIGDGTSFSSPIVAGVALMMKAKNPTWTPGQIAAKLASSASDRGPDGIDDSYGHGFLDAYGAVGGRTAASPPPATGDSHEPNDVPGRATPLSGPAQSTIAPEGDVDWYVHEVAFPEVFSVSFSGAVGENYGFVPVVEAYGPNAERLEPVRSVSDTAFQADTPGRYVFRVRNARATRSETYGVNLIHYASFGGPEFSPFESYTVGSVPQTVAITDVTGDDRPDVLATTTTDFENEPSDFSLIVLAQRADGSLGSPTLHPITESSFAGPASLAVGDVDNDGDEDVAVATGNSIDLFEVDAGELTTPNVLAAPGSSVLEIADVDGDATNEFVFSGPEGTKVGRLGSDGQFELTPIDAKDLTGIEVGDVTGDDRPDIVGSYGRTIRRLQQTADGAFVPDDRDFPFALPPEYGLLVYDVEIADVTGDGRADVTATGGTTQPEIAVFAQQPDGSLGEPSHDGLSTTNPGAVEAHDMNGDTRLDLVVFHPSSEKVGVLHQRPDGTLETERVYVTPYSWPRTPTKALAVGDVSGDGLPDIVTPTEAAGIGAVSVLRQRANISPVLAIWVHTTNAPDNSRNVARTFKPSLTFARDIDPSSIVTTNARLILGSTGEVLSTALAYSPSNRTLSFDMSNPLAEGRTYVLDVRGLRDTSGRTMTEPFTSRFKVVATNTTSARADVNGDGYDDVIVGAPDEDFGTKTNVGVMHVLYGSASGAKTSGSVMITEDTANVPGTAESGDRFGAAIATGDVNNDGYDDVAVGAPGQKVGAATTAGVIHVFLGSPSGLRTSGSQQWTQDTTGIPETAETNDKFGSSLAFGDFDNAAGADLAVGSPGEKVGSFTGAGAVHVLSGRSGGVTGAGVQLWTQENIDSFVGPGNAFGYSLAAGDFDGDTHDDLAIGAPYEDVFEGDEGTVTLMTGTVVGLRPQYSLISEMVQEELSVKGEKFGAALAAEDFGGMAAPDGYDDLAIGSPGAGSGAGRVDVMFGDWIGLGFVTASTRQVGNGNQPEAGDAFGGALAAGRVKGSPTAWLAIGASGEDIGSVIDAGVVHVAAPATWLISATVPAPITQNTTNIPDDAEKNDRFGVVLRLLDVDKDGQPDVVAGVPNENIGSASGAGRTFVIRRAQAITRIGQLLTQGSGGLPETAQSGDHFGTALGG